MKWSVPKMWEGETVAILASGPSMSQEVADRVARRALRTIAINTTFQLAPWADILYAADGQWWDRHWKHAKNFQGLKVTIEPNALRPELLTLKNNMIGGFTGFDPNPDTVKSGKNGGYQAVCIAMHAGAKRIELYGMDMRSIENKHHWHGNHPSPLRNHGESMYKPWIENFKTLRPEVEKRGIELINYTPGSALQWPAYQAEPQQLAA